MLRPKSRDGRRVDKSYRGNRLYRIMSIKKRGYGSFEFETEST